jgi:hypothetical protein
MALFPRGVIPAVEAQQKHKRFVDAIEPDYALVKIDKARQIVKRGETAESYFPGGTRVITTSTIMDSKLEALPTRSNGYKRGELEIIRDFQPDFCIPADHADYYNMPDDQRMARVRSAVEATIDINDRLVGEKPTVIPLMKGSRRVERELFYEMCDQLGKDYIADYAREYFGRAGGGTERLAHDVGLVADERDYDVLLVGTCSPYVFERVPDNVVAGAGFHQWFGRVEPKTDSPDEMRAAFADLRREGREALGLPPVDAEGVKSPTDGETSSTTTETNT